MNEKIAAYLAFIFLFLVGVFNIVFVLSNLKKRKAKKALLWLRLIGGVLILLGSLAFGYYFIWMKLQA